MRIYASQWPPSTAGISSAPPLNETALKVIWRIIQPIGNNACGGGGACIARVTAAVSLGSLNQVVQVWWVNPR
ncbi:MAG: hypothetical protein ACLRJU_30510 [Enterocloster sp.]